MYMDDNKLFSKNVKELESLIHVKELESLIYEKEIGKLNICKINWKA